jgi:AmpE protein
MKLLALLLALGVERLFSPHRDAVLHRGLWDAIRRLLPIPAMWRSAVLPVLALVAFPLLAAWLDQLARTHRFEPLYAALLLFLCLGPRDLADDVHALRAARARNDDEAVARLIRALQSGPEPDADHRSLLGALFIQSHERVFGVLWWFLIAGPAGAVLYRLASRLPRLIEDSASPAARTAELLHALLAWVPIRLSAAALALAGSMDQALKAWHRLRATADADWQRRSWTVLAEVAVAALDWEGTQGSGDFDTPLAEVLRMQTRAELLLLAVAALFTAGVWIA